MNKSHKIAITLDGEHYQKLLQIKQRTGGSISAQLNILAGKVVDPPCRHRRQQIYIRFGKKYAPIGDYCRICNEVYIDPDVALSEASAEPSDDLDPVWVQLGKTKQPKSMPLPENPYDNMSDPEIDKLYATDPLIHDPPKDIPEKKTWYEDE